MRFLLAWIALVVCLPRQASAYPFFIEHGYTACAYCHVDPSGGGPLSEYGRSQAEILLRTPWSARSAEWEPSAIKNFAFGVPLPAWLALQTDTRALVIPRPGETRILLMQADLRAAVQVSDIVAYASAGVVSEGAQKAWVTQNDAGVNLVSREHWLGWSPAKGLLVRGGRLALPFGIRSEEHLLFARAATETDANDDQQLGIDAVYGGKKFRAEIMGILGNMQVSPDVFRERGYSFAGGYSPTRRVEVGVSSLLAHSVLDPATLTERIRQAYGLFARVSPKERVGVFAEADLTVDGTLEPRLGTAGYLQVDVEAARGLHIKGTGEWCDADLAAAGNSLRGSATALWFFAPHMDIRADAIYGTLGCTPEVESRFMALAQLHFFM